MSTTNMSITNMSTTNNPLIHISDELPEPGQRVIGVTVNNDFDDYENLGEYEFGDIDHWYGNNGCTDKITHWLPLSYIGLIENQKQMTNDEQ